MVAKDVKDLLIGVVTGVVSMLPGASGATILVIFGVYGRLIKDVSHIRECLLKDLRFVIVILIGIVIGFFAAAKGLDWLIEDWEIPLMFFFAALIIVQIPVIKEMGDDGEPITPWNVAAFIVGFALIMLVMLFGFEGDYEPEGAVGFALMFLVGIIFGLSKMAPGISASTVLLALGLFEAFTAAVSDLDLRMLLPMGLGLVFSVLVLSKGIDYGLSKHRKSSYAVILGLTVGSVVDVLYRGVGGFEDDMLLVVIVCIVVGLAIGYCLNRLAKLYTSENPEQSR